MNSHQRRIKRRMEERAFGNHVCYSFTVTISRFSDADQEFLDRCKSLLSERASDPPYVHWVLNQHGDDLEGNYCPECVKAELARVKAEQGDVGEDDETRSIHEYPESEDDSSRHCETCGALLAYTLADPGGELYNFSDADARWDWNNPDDCYELDRLANCVYTDEQKRELIAVLKRGENPPPELTAN